jgi:hypothetical protein
MSLILLFAKKEPAKHLLPTDSSQNPQVVTGGKNQWRKKECSGKRGF